MKNLKSPSVFCIIIINRIFDVVSAYAEICERRIHMTLKRGMRRIFKRAFVFVISAVTILAMVLPLSARMSAVVARAATGTTYKYGKYSAKAGRADVLLNGTRYRTTVEYVRSGSTNMFTIGELGDESDQSLTFAIADSYIKENKTYTIKSFKSSKTPVNFTAKGFSGLNTAMTSKWSKYGKYFDKVTLKLIQADKAGINTMYFSVKFHNAKNEVFTATGFFAYKLEIGDVEETKTENPKKDTDTGNSESDKKLVSNEKIYTYGDFETVEGMADIIVNGRHYLVNASCSGDDTSSWKFVFNGFGNAWQIEYDIESDKLEENRSIGTDVFFNSIYTSVYAYNFPLHDEDYLFVCPFYLYSNASYFDEISFMPVSMPKLGVMTAYFTLKFNDGQNSYSFEGFMAAQPGKTYDWSAGSLVGKNLESGVAGRIYTMEDDMRVYEAEEGKADVYYNGKRYSTNASFSLTGNIFHFTVGNFDGDKNLSFSVHQNYLTEYYSVSESYFFKYSDANFFAYHFPLKDSGKEYIFPNNIYGNTGYFDEITLTPVRMDDGGVTTAYFSVTFRDTSGGAHTITGLIAAALDKNYTGSSENKNTGNSGSSGNAVSLDLCMTCYGSGRCGICHGTRTCQSCAGRGGMSYNTWGQGGSGWVDCAGCHGSKKCKYCSGTGKCSTCNGTGKR